MSEQMDEAMKEVYKTIAENKARIAYLLDEEEMQDDDGYPTDAALEVISKWHWDDVAGWFAFIKSIWYLSSWGWREVEEDDEFEEGKKKHIYYISTAGWSGNESIIHAMEDNRMLMAITWVQSRRGGHYIFELNQPR